jgi:DNA polymerase (family 10)
MPLHNREIADKFDELADLLEIEGANRFRVRAYRDAARTVRGYSKSMNDLVKSESDLTELPGIGKDLAEKIKIMTKTGKLPLLQEVEKHVPPALSEIMHIEGVGPKRTKMLYDKLQVSSTDDLKKALTEGKVRELEGFGKKTEQTIKDRLGKFTGTKQRTKLIEAEDIAKPLLAYINKSKGLKQAIVAGSYRRRKETVGDLDILVTVKQDNNVMERFIKYDEVDEIISQGKTRSTVQLRSGIHIDLRAVPQVSYGAALHYFTGSKAHNIAIRKIGVKKGYKINEYGVFKGDKRIAGKTEEEVYKKVGLPYIVPELREDRGEIDAAKKGKLPELIRLKDIRGDLHSHTKATDGHETLEQMAKAAADRHYQYLAITDHSKHVTVAHGLDKTRLLKQIKAIDKLNGKLDNIRLLKSSEVDILEDGSLDLPDSILKELDLTVCSIHYKFNLSRKKQTERIIRAMDNPYFNIFAHPHGRLINERESYDIDMAAVMKAAKERNCIIELNAHPDRLDLMDDDCILAKQIGIKIAISTDAHSTFHLDYMRFGVDQARRGWLEKDDVINTRPLNKLLKSLKRT